MGDRGADLALDVVADDRHAGILETLPPFRILGDEDRDAVDEADPRRQRLLSVEARARFTAHRQVVDQHVGFGVAQHLGHVHRLRLRLGDDLAQVFAQAIQRRPALHGHTQLRYIRELVGVVLPSKDGLAEVLADLVVVHVERSHELDVADVVAAQVHMHQARDAVLGFGVPIVADTLDQAAGAVAYACDSDTYFAGHDEILPCLKLRPAGGRMKYQSASADRAASLWDFALVAATYRRRVLASDSFQNRAPAESR